MVTRFGSVKFDSHTSIQGGSLEIGNVGEQGTPLHLYSPNEFDPACGSQDFVLAGGLLALPIQYKHLGESLVANNHRLTVFGHDHHFHQWPIRANAADILSGFHKLELEHFTAIGHSMGTIAVLLALEEDAFAKATNMVIEVDPAMTGNHMLYKPKDYLHMVQEAQKLTIKHPADAFLYAYGAVNEIRRRPLVIGNQMLRLVTGVVHQRYEELTAKHPDTPFVVIFNHNDGLVPEEWSASLQGDNMHVYVHHSPEGLAHSAINVDPTMADGIIQFATKHRPPDTFVPVYHGDWLNAQAA